MLTELQNERLCRVGPKAPMGRMMREYWFPVLLSEELAPACDPKRVRLLGENFVAFRDSGGRVGIIDEACPHRGASMAIARVEDAGLRCLFHGWVLDVEGKLVEVPTEPEDSPRKGRVPPTGHLVREAGGVIWVYIGRKASPPRFPDFAWTKMPAENVIKMKAITECNYAQNVEGVIDSVHTNFLHSDVLTGTAARVGEAGKIEHGAHNRIVRPSLDKHPKICVQNTAYGFRYGAIRKPIVDADKNQYIRTTLWIAPSTVTFSAAKNEGFMQIMTPIDDDTTIFWHFRYSYAGPFSELEHKAYPEWTGLARDGKNLDQNFRPFRNRANNWLQDRAAMRRNETFSGITGVNTEDFAAAESMGPIVDRSRQHLGPTDLAVARMRRLMLQSLERYEAGETPVGLAGGFEYSRVQAEEKVIPLTTPWQTVGAFAGEPTVDDGSAELESAEEI